MSNPLIVDCVLMDVEGTTSSIEFVHAVMFPFARHELAGYLKAHWNDDSLAACLELLAKDVGTASREAWLGPRSDDEQDRRTVVEAVSRMMDRDAKATGLKQLQGMIWKAGFESGRLVAHVYPDVPPALDRWRNAGIGLRIYSSGSIQAQRLFFGHTAAGNLLDRLDGHYDTTSGGKREAASYVRIASDVAVAPERILFLSDIPEELDAAAEAGMQTRLLCRPGNASVPSDRHLRIDSFAELELSGPRKG